ncbi:hypothetical protein QRX60_39535 [Amycolatopsis mongoliensis]|uniref:DJ-1/PfpI domain-containing protein n=1 Tax=Amycolatopsis mongoliensis TaxID=715475 RepID=A0A9Y2JKB0_9PSEU|nr:hypothetical protein [Amycolatopsis sp. 4-36]WIY00095.1 hypothetical protein QRX60_39535 [Amycolatopsis sp. 4-36]
MARVLVLTGDAAEELDTMYPIFRLRESGHEAVVAAPATLSAGRREARLRQPRERPAAAPRTATESTICHEATHKIPG